MKKAISLGVAAAMAATLLAGCGTAASSAPAASSEAAPAEAAPAGDFDADQDSPSSPVRTVPAPAALLSS